MVQGKLAQLACGDFVLNDSMKDIFDYLQRSINDIERRIIPLLSDPVRHQDDITLVGPFYGRKLLETVCNVLIGRFDPMRLLVIKKIQSSSQFKIEKKSNVAVQWSGDIFEKSNDRIQQDNLWNPELNIDKVGRYLLGPYYFDLYWKPAFVMARDIHDTGTHFLQDYGAEFDEERMQARLRHEASGLFSSFSKGVHSELVVDVGNTLDSSTIIDKLREAYKLCRTLAFLSHLVDTTHNRLPIDNAYQLYVDIKNNV